MISPFVIFCYLAGIYGDFVQIRNMSGIEKRRETLWAVILWGWVLIALISEMLIKYSWKSELVFVLGFGVIVFLRWSASRKSKSSKEIKK